VYSFQALLHSLITDSDSGCNAAETPPCEGAAKTPPSECENKCHNLTPITLGQPDGSAHLRAGPRSREGA
jgi:hypothetical protein